MINESNGAPGAWRWNVKRFGSAGWETVASSDRAYFDHDEAKEAAQAFVSAETI